MDPDVNWLLTLCDGDTTIKVAIGLTTDMLPESCFEFPMEPESREALHSILPDHCKEFGKIVAVEKIFDVLGWGS